MVVLLLMAVAERKNAAKNTSVASAAKIARKSN